MLPSEHDVPLCKRQRRMNRNNACEGKTLPVVESETYRSPSDSHWAKNIYLKEEYSIFQWYKIKFPYAPFVSQKFGL